MRFSEKPLAFVLVYNVSHFQGTPTTLESQFRLTYSMLLNIMRVESLRYVAKLPPTPTRPVLVHFCLPLLHVHGRVEDMMKRSFAEQDSMRQAGDREQQMKDLQKNLLAMEQLDCAICGPDIEQYFASCASIASMKREMQV